MRFWDTSALVPLIVAEPDTGRVVRWLAADPEVIAWTFTRLEVLSALARRRRASPRDTDRLLAARRDFLAAWEHWSEITAVEVVRRHAERIVETHPLRAADALQLAAALVAAADHAGPLAFVTLDRTLARAAEQEGLAVVR